MPVNRMPRDASRVRVQVELRDRTSTSPNWSAVKRCCELSGTHFTLFASPRTAAATARQKSTSKPFQLPWLSAAENPGAEVLTPHTSCPRCLTASRVFPASAVVTAHKPVRAAANAAIAFLLMLVSSSGRICWSVGQRLAARSILEELPQVAVYLADRVARTAGA